MSEMPDVLPGETVESSWGNDIRDRTIQRYVDATERDFLNSTPEEGDLAYLQNTNELQYYDGTEWLTVLDESDGPFLRLAGGTMLGQILGFLGSAANPGFSFTTDTVTGMFRAGASRLGFATGGAQTTEIAPPNNYATSLHAGSQTMRNILIGTSIPDDSWGKDGDVYIRHIP